MPSLALLDLGIMPYGPAWDVQRQWHARIVRGKRGEDTALDGVLLLVEHPHVFTLGKITEAANVLISDEELARIGAEKFSIDRGGDVTYHGPGQLVGYPILDLSRWNEDLHWYLRTLEESIIGTLAHYGLEGYRVEGRTGVWVNDKKICAIGIRSASWVTMHGFAFNVSTDLSYFEHIIPCGIADKGVTSLNELLGTAPPMAEVKEIYAQNFARVFACELQREPLAR